MPVHHLMQQPFDVFLVTCPSAPPHVANDHCYEEMKDLNRRYFGCEFRGVSLDRLEAIGRNYIDVEPTNAAIFADCLDKALGYGDWPKVVMALRRSSLKRSFKIVPAATSDEDLETIRREYPTLVRMSDGSSWCSRLPEDDSRIYNGYELAYGWYIPGDPREALAAVFLCCRPEDSSIVSDYFRARSSGETNEAKMQTESPALA